MGNLHQKCVAGCVFERYIIAVNEICDPCKKNLPQRGTTIDMVHSRLWVRHSRLLRHLSRCSGGSIEAIEW